MSILWECGMPFLWLRQRGLSFGDSLDALGMKRVDWAGILVVMPLAIAAFGVLALPYFAFGYEPLRAWLDRVPLLHMPSWHVFYYGYYNFPLVPLLLVILGNFVGEEIYFRGYLQKRLSWLGPYRAVLAGNFLFLTYHLWQAPVNWAMLPVFFLIPLCYLMAWRKSLWVAIAAHVVFNLGAFDLIFEAARGIAGR